MKQLFLGRKRILLFKPGSSQAPGPTTRMTKFTFIDGTYDEVPAEGELNVAWFTSHNYYSGGTWLKKIISIELGENVTVDESALEGLDLMPVYDGNGKKFSEWVFSGTSAGDGYHWECQWVQANDSFILFKVSNTDQSNITAVYYAGHSPDEDVLLNFSAAGTSVGDIDVTATRTENSVIGYTHQKTLFTLEGGTVETYDITGTLNQQWMITNGYYDDEGTWLKTITQADIGNTVTSIGPDSFYGCSGLTSVTIGNGVTSIGSEAFSYCRGLTSVTIPDSVTSIGDYAFCNCTSLTSVTIPDSVTSIGDSAFDGCSNLTSATIPNSVTSIGKWAFSRCRGLTSVTIPDSVTSIGRDAFSGCSGLTSVTITANGGNAASVKQKMIDAGVPENITWNMPTPEGHADTWYKYAGDTEWRTVSITGSIYGEIGGPPTSQIPDIENVVALEIGTDVTSIRTYAFCWCQLTSVMIPDSITNIADDAFSDCYNIMSISVSSGNANYKSANGLLLSKDGKTLIRGVNGNVTIPDSVTNIGYSAFKYCPDLTSMTIGNGVTSIGDEAFDACYGLTSVTIPDSVTSIGSYAFDACSGLTSVTIGNGVTSIGEYAFAIRRDARLTSITFNSFTKNQVKSMTTEHHIFGDQFYDSDWNLMAKSFTAVCTDGSMTINFSADEPATITFTDL